MADHFVTGQSVYLHFQCGNGRCRKLWEQPNTDPRNPGWNICPHCNFAAPTNVWRPFMATLGGEAT